MSDLNSFALKNILLQMQKDVKKYTDCKNLTFLDCFTHKYFVFFYLIQGRGKRLLNLSFKVHKGKK